MVRLPYTDEQIKDAARILDTLARVPSERRSYVTAVVEAYIAGLTSQAKSE